MRSASSRRTPATSSDGAWYSSLTSSGSPRGRIRESVWRSRGLPMPTDVMTTRNGPRSEGAMREGVSVRTVGSAGTLMIVQPPLASDTTIVLRGDTTAACRL